MVMKQLGAMVDLEGLEKEGEHITPFNSYDEYIVEREYFGLDAIGIVEREGIKKHFDLHGLDKSEPFLFVESDGIDGGEVFVGEDRLGDLLHYMKNEPQTYKRFMKHASLTDYYLSEVKDKLDNTAVDYEVDSTRFGWELYIDDDSVGKGIITINSHALSLYVGDYEDETDVFLNVQSEEKDSLDDLLEAIDSDLIKSVKVKNNSKEMEM